MLLKSASSFPATTRTAISTFLKYFRRFRGSNQLSFGGIFLQNSAIKMMATNKENRPVTLPEGVSLRRVAEVLLDAWEAGAHEWTDSPLQLPECETPKPAMPVPQVVLDLCRRVAERRVPYLLGGGLE